MYIYCANILAFNHDSSNCCYASATLPIALVVDIIETKDEPVSFSKVLGVKV